MTGLSTEELIRTLAPMLFDSSPHVRQNVVRALAGCGYWESTLLIELKVVGGDPDPGVLGECFIELLNADIDRYLPLVTEHLDDFNSEIRIQAICTFSECRSARGVETLIASLNPFTEFSHLEQVYLALGRSRHEIATNFLNDRLTNGSKLEQACALRSLAQRLT
jgi:HEAT repeat protein